MAEMTLKQLADSIGGTLCGDGERIVRSAAAVGDAGEDQVAFVANRKYLPQVAETRAAAVIVEHDYDGAVADGTALIRCDDPYFAYREAMVQLYGFRKHPIDGVDETARIDPGARLDPSVRVGAYVIIGAGASIGENTIIYPGVFIGPEVTVGKDCILYPNVCLYDRTVLGDRVSIHANSSVGVDGFGYATHPLPSGEVVHDKIPPAGRVVLEDDVEIGSCCAIERATMGDTVIGRGTKFADLVAIGHGTKMGKHCLMVSQAGIAGSTLVGDYGVFGGQAGVVGHIRIGDRVRVGAQAGVTGDIEPDTEVLGSPAIPRIEAGRSYTLIARLPEMRATIKSLTRQVEKLQQQLDALSGPEREA
jgi:UDP-3-O-[3-hydroxymyristoyl] glucosamine N-acyltransferase